MFNAPIAILSFGLFDSIEQIAQFEKVIQKEKLTNNGAFLFCHK